MNSLFAAFLSGQRTKGGGLLVGRMAVDRISTVTQVNNCEQSEGEVGLDKRFLNSQRQP